MSNDPRTQRTEHKIISCFMNEMKNTDFDKIKVKTLVDEAKITRGTFYVHFGDIYELLTHIENSLLDEIPEFIEEKLPVFDPKNEVTTEIIKVKKWDIEFFEYYKRNAEYLNIILGTHGDKSFLYKLRRKVQDMIHHYMIYEGLQNDNLMEYLLNTIPDFYLICAKEWTLNEKMSHISAYEIANIISCLRAGSIIKQHLHHKKQLIF